MFYKFQTVWQINNALIQKYFALNGICSDTKIIEFGVPQGLILDPLLFSIYINDLNRSLTSGNCIMYANDTNVFLKNNYYKKTLQNCKPRVDKY